VSDRLLEFLARSARNVANDRAASPGRAGTRILNRGVSDSRSAGFLGDAGRRQPITAICHAPWELVSAAWFAVGR